MPDKSLKLALMASAVVGDQLAYAGRAVQALWILLFLGAVGIYDIDCPNKDKSAHEARQEDKGR